MNIQRSDDFNFIFLISIAIHFVVLLILYLGFSEKHYITFDESEIEIMNVNKMVQRSESRTGVKSETITSSKKFTKVESRQNSFRVKSQESPKEVSPNIEKRFHADKDDLVKNASDFSSSVKERTYNDGVSDIAPRDFKENAVASEQKGVDVKKENNSLTQNNFSWTTRSRKAIFIPPFKLPDELKGVRAIVVIRITVDPAGRVVAALVTQNSPYSELDRLCRENVKKYLFEPINGKENSVGAVTTIFKTTQK